MTTTNGGRSPNGRPTWKPAAKWPLKGDGRPGAEQTGVKPFYQLPFSSRQVGHREVW